MTNKRVLLGMSGGLDSSVAAALLKRDGYDVIGVTIKTYKYEEVGGAVGNETSCCSLDGINDARRVADALGIPHYVYDFTEPFSREIIDYFVAGYLAGDTPNPCTMCNRKIKWAEMIRRADALGADFIATGHYARIDQDAATGRHVLRRGHDDSKDQSYALWAVSQESLARTMFPLADLTKEESRAIAREYNLPVAAKKESYEICFIPDDDYRRFLKENVDGLEEQVALPRPWILCEVGVEIGQSHRVIAPSKIQRRPRPGIKRRMRRPLAQPRRLIGAFVPGDQGLLNRGGLRGRQLRQRLRQR